MGYTRKALATRGRILDCAAGLLVAQGYTQLKLDRVLAEASVQKGNFYYYFGSKHDLCLAVLKERIAPWLLEWYESLLPTKHSAESALAELPLRVTEQLGNRSTRVLDYLLLAFELNNVSREFRQELLALQDREILHFSLHLAAGLAAGGDAGNQRAASTALALLLNGAMLRYRLTDNLPELQQLLTAGVSAVMAR